MLEAQLIMVINPAYAASMSTNPALLLCISSVDQLTLHD